MAAVGQQKKSSTLYKIEKAAESYSVLTCDEFSHEDAVAPLPTTNPSGILTIEKLAR